MGYLYAVLCFVIFGSSYPIAGAAMTKIPVYIFTELTLIVATIVSIPLARMKEPEIKWTKLGGSNYLKIFLQALIGALLYTIFLLYGLKFSSPVVASIISSITPATTMVAASFVLKEKITVPKIIAIILAVGAVMVQTVNFESGPSTFNLLGLIFMLLSVGCTTTYLVLAKQISYEMPPFTMTAGLIIPSTIMILPFCIYEMMYFDMSTLTYADWWVIVYYGAIVWYVPYLFTYLALKYLPASVFGTTTAITPVAAAITSVLFFGAHMRIVNYIGIVLVIISVSIINRSENNERKALS